jgi:hypothetical protein
MKKAIIIIIGMALLLAACAHARYQDGNRIVEYTSVGRTADVINADLKKGTVKVEGQKIETKVIDLLNNLLEAAK